MRKHSKGEIAKKILLLAVAGGALAAVIVLPGLGILFKIFNANNYRERERVKSAMRRLEETGYLTPRIKNGREEYVITKKGKNRIVEYLLEDLKIEKPKKWDGRWRVLMFDIPEKNAKARREVSFKLKDIGMKAIQDSVFISPYPCYEQIQAVGKHYFVDKFFIYLEADTVEGSGNLLEKFNLK